MFVIDIVLPEALVPLKEARRITISRLELAWTPRCVFIILASQHDLASIPLFGHIGLILLFSFHFLFIFLFCTF